MRIQCARREKLERPSRVYSLTRKLKLNAHSLRTWNHWRLCTRIIPTKRHYIHTRTRARAEQTNADHRQRTIDRFGRIESICLPTTTLFPVFIFLIAQFIIQKQRSQRHFLFARLHNVVENVLPTFTYSLNHICATIIRSVIHATCLFCSFL